MSLIKQLTYKFNIRSTEVKLIRYLLAHAFCWGIVFSLYFAAANTLFLNTFEISILPYAYIASGVVGYFIGYFLSAIQKKKSFRSVLYINLVLLICFTAVIFLGLKTQFLPRKPIVFLTFIWIRPLMYLIELEFWGLSGKLLDVRQGKRLFGLISTGAVMAWIIGMFAIPALIKISFFGVEDIILLTVLVMCFWFVLQVKTQKVFKNRFKNDVPKKDVVDEGAKEFTMKSMLTKSFFRKLFIVAACSSFLLIVVDFTFLSLLNERFTNKESIASFLGIFFGIMGFVQLIAKTFLTSKIIEQYGMKVAIISLPVLVLLFTLFLSGSMYLGLSLTFIFVAMLKQTEQISRVSFYDPGFQLLFQPIDTKYRPMVQSKVGGMVGQFSIVLAGVSLLICTYTFQQGYLVLLIGVSVLMISTTLILSGKYKSFLLKVLKERSVQLNKKSEVTNDMNTLGDSIIQENENFDVKTEVVKHIEYIVYLLYSIRDLRKSITKDNRGLIDKEIVDQYKLIYDLLEVGYDKQTVQNIKLNTLHAEGDLGFALELIDNFFDKDISEPMLVLFDEKPIAEKLKKLDKYSLTPHLELKDRLLHLFNFDYSLMSKDLKLMAFKLYVKEGYDMEVHSVIALLKHPDRQFSKACEEAAFVI